MKQRNSSTARLKGILFVHHTISRKDLIELSKLNPRTVSRCMEELVAQNQVEISRKVVSLGQPQIYYTLREKSIYFLVLTAVRSEIYALLCDNRGFPLDMYRQEFTDGDYKKMLPAVFFNTAKKFSEQLAEQGKKIYSIAINLADGNIYSAQFKNKLINMLQPFCEHNAVCGYADEFLLSQYAINNYFSGRVLGLIHKHRGGWMHVATNGYLSDPATVLKINNLLDTVTDFSCNFKLLELLDFNCFLKYLYEEFYSSLKNLGDSCYSEVYSRALNGDLRARDILEDYAVLLGKSVVSLSRKIHFDAVVLMHSRPIIIEKVQAVIANESSPGEKIPFVTANFSSNEFLYVPVGYLRRELFSFEHGKFLPDLQN